MTKYIFILIFILSSFQAHACKIPPIYSEEKEKDLHFLESFINESLEIYVGKIIDDKDAIVQSYPVQIFVTKKIWRQGKRSQSYEATRWYKRELNKENLKLGEYDFVSSHGVIFCSNPNLKRSQIPDKTYLYIGNNSVQYTIPINIAKPLLNKLSKIKNFWGDINPSWQFCETDTECRVVSNKCGKKIGVNEKYETDYLNFLKSNEAMKIDCKKEDGKKEALIKKKCVDYFCE